MTSIEAVMKEVLSAPESRREAALKVLRGEVTELAARPATTGPLLLGMLAGAKFLGVSRVTMWRMMKAGTIGKVELFPGSCWLRREDLEALGASRAGKEEEREVRSQKSEFRMERDVNTKVAKDAR